MSNIWETVYKTFIVLISLIMVTKLMGRRSIAQLTLYDYVVGLILGNVGASFAVGDSVSIAEGLASLTTATIWILGVNYVSEKSLTVRKFMDSEPVIVIYQGRIWEENLKKKFYNVNDLLRALREQGVFDPNDVEVAVIESDGQVSVMEKRKPSEQDTLESNTEGSKESYSKLLGRELIIDGKILDKSLRESNITAEWLEAMLTNHNIPLSDVTLAMVTPDGKLYIDTKNDSSNEPPYLN